MPIRSWGVEVPVQRDHDRRGSSRVWWIALLLALVAIWVVWWQWDAIRPGAPTDPVADDGEATPSAMGPPTKTAEPTEPTEVERATARWSEMLGADPSWPADFAEPDDCEQVDAELRRICGLLDAREYIRTSATPTGSCGLVRQVAEELASRPPEIASELRGYDTMTANAFHLFRTLGRRRTALLRRIIREEDELAEPAALALFRWAVSRERCRGPRDTPLTGESLYAHAGFLFHTLGGQAYLRRRSPRTEALIGFYALVVLDRAQRRGFDPAGIDPRNEIQRTRRLIEREPLVHRERYLAVLDEMAERWKKRSEPS